MWTTSRLIVYAGIAAFLAFGARAYTTDKDIPANVQVILMVIITGGMASEGVQKGLGHLKRPDEDERRQDDAANKSEGEKKPDDTPEKPAD